MFKLIYIYLVILILYCVIKVNAQPTTDQQHYNTATCGSDQQMNLAQELLERCKLVRQEMQTYYINQLTELQKKYENISQVLNTVLSQQTQAKECESSLNASLFLDNTTLLGVISGNTNSNGFSVLSSQLFLIGSFSIVKVYNTNNMTFTRSFTINGSISFWTIVASLEYNCLYISDVGLGVVYRYNIYDNVISNWSVGGVCYGLSLTSAHNVLLTLYTTKQLKEYTPDGNLVREISLDSSIEAPWHSVQLSSGQFVVSHGWDGSLHRVCVVDTSGRIIKCYGGAQGSGVGQLNRPSNLAVDGQGNVLVADYFNNRVVLLSPSLTHLGYITIPGYTLDHPSALHLDLLTRRLYIGEFTSRVFVLIA